MKNGNECMIKIGSSAHNANFAMHKRYLIPGRYIHHASKNIILYFAEASQADEEDQFGIEV